MPRYAAGTKSSGAGVAGTRPIGSLFAGANTPLNIIEIGVFNTTTTAVEVELAYCTAQGTPGTGLSEVLEDQGQTAPTAAGTAFDTHSADATVAGRVRPAVSLAGAIGAAFVWDFRDRPLRVEKGTGNGIGILPVGTGQVLRWYVVWDE